MLLMLDNFTKIVYKLQALEPVMSSLVLQLDFRQAWL